MKLIVICLTTIIFQVSAESFAQKITLSKKNAPFSEIIKDIGNQSDYDFIYKLSLLKKAKPISIDVEKADIKDVLKLCFENQPFTYVVENKAVIVKEKSFADNKDFTSQIIDISGKVTDEKGDFLPGASVRIKGTNSVVVTDANGRFTLKGVPKNAVILISFIGFDTREINIGSSETINVKLIEQKSSLNEVVVIGYGTQKRSNVSSAISTFTLNETNQRPVLSPDQMIQGRMAGVSVSAASGTPGAAQRVSVRGTGSLTASNNPLYVIDGVPVVSQSTSLYNFGENINPLAALNPNDIESVDVLKDAASASIYGSRATNGVIIITTKSGKKGKSNINLDAYTGIQNVPNLGNLKMSSSDLYVTTVNEGIDNYNAQYGYSPGASNYIKRIANPYPGLEDTNWLDEILRTARMNSVNLSLSGGTDKGSYFLSGNYTSQEGATITNKLEKYTAKVNITQNMFSWLKAGANTNFSFSNNNRVPGSNLGTATLPKSLSQRPFDRPYKPDGSYYVGGTNDLVYHNSLQILNEEKAYLDNYRLLGNVFADLKLGEDFLFKTSFGADLIYTHDYVYYMHLHPYGTGKGRLIDNRNLVNNIVFENTINYKKALGGLSIDGLLGHSFQRTSNSTSGIDGNGFPSQSFDVLTAASVITDATTNLFANSLESYFGRANLAFNNKYLLSLSMRADGSSRFAPENRWGYFPSASAGWLISNEDFWKAEKADLKLKLSYGATGNQDGISNYAYQALTSGGYNYNTSSGIALTTLGNRNLTWEKASQFDAGVDFNLNNGGIIFTADYFIKNTKNLLYSKPTYATTGFTSIISNIGSMKNNGFEFSLNTNLNFGQVKWNSGFNISFIKNRLTSLIGDDELLSIGGNRALKVGKPIGTFWVYKQLGIFQDDSEVPAPLYNIGVRAGDVKFEDVNEDGNIDINDRQIVGDSSPKSYGGWNNTFRYKKFDLSVFMTFMQGNHVYASWRLNTEKLGSNAFNTKEEVALNRWTGPGTSNTTPRAIYGLTYNLNNSSRFLEDGSFIRLRTVSLGYDLPSKLINKIKANRMRIYLQGDNLLLFTNYSGLDPEVNSSMDPRFIGEDNLVLPQSRSFTFGLNLNF